MDTKALELRDLILEIIRENELTDFYHLVLALKELGNPELELAVMANPDYYDALVETRAQCLDEERDRVDDDIHELYEEKAVYERELADVDETLPQAAVIASLIQDKEKELRELYDYREELDQPSKY